MQEIFSFPKYILIKQTNVLIIIMFLYRCEHPSGRRTRVATSKSNTGSKPILIEFYRTWHPNQMSSIFSILLYIAQVIFMTSVILIPTLMESNLLFQNSRLHHLSSPAALKLVAVAIWLVSCICWLKQGIRQLLEQKLLIQVGEAAKR